MNTKLLVFLSILFLIIFYVLVKSKSLILFGFFISLILSLSFLFIFTFVRGYQNRILKFLIFTFYAISAVLFSNIEDDNKFFKGLTNTILSYYLWSLGFVSIIIACLYPKNYSEAKDNFYIRTLVFLNFLILSIFALYGIIEYINNRYSKTKVFCLNKSNYDSDTDKRFCYILRKVLGNDFNRIGKNKKKLTKRIFGDEKKDESRDIQLVILILIFIFFLAFIASKMEDILDKIKIDRFSYLNVIYLLILYIPCLFLDGLRFLNKEFKIAKNETILLLIILLVLCALYFIYPIIYKNFAYKNSTLLLNKPKDLNFITELGHTKHLKTHKNSKNPFKKTYNKKKIYSKKTLATKNELDKINEEMKGLCWDLSANDIEYDNITNSDCITNGSDISAYKVEDVCNELLNLDSEYDIERIDTDPEKKETIKCKMYNMYIKRLQLDNSYNEFLEKDKEEKKEKDENSKDKDEDKNIKVINKVINNYSISFWLYIEPTQENVNNYWTNILNFGEKIKISYSIIGTNLNLLEFKIRNNKNEYEVIHVQSNIKSQKWNNFVLVYNDYIMDIFFNTRLVSSTQNLKVSNNNDIIMIGENNGISGSICNLFYYYGYIDINKIKENYKNLINKNPPII
tara:strand:+ start:5602 stop:7482 length:1881 start_codon:yes stop_codon:yes gene_type:complete